MNKTTRIVLGFLLCLIPAISYAHHGHHGYHRHHPYHGPYYPRSYPNVWHTVVPAVVAGAIVYSIHDWHLRNEAHINCSPWTEVQRPDGTNDRVRTCWETK